MKKRASRKDAKKTRSKEEEKDKSRKHEKTKIRKKTEDKERIRKQVAAAAPSSSVWFSPSFSCFRPFVFS
jgi:hypothetical protein